MVGNLDPVGVARPVGHFLGGQKTDIDAPG